MKNMLPLIFLLCLASCDCYQLVTGTVADQATGQPLQGATICLKNKTWDCTRSDSTGHFEISEISGGFNCPPITFVVTMDQYEKAEYSLRGGGQLNVMLHRSSAETGGSSRP